MAQAVLGFPETIILDEPTVGLDPKQIIEIRELIRELAKDHTVILSSHILAEIREVCDYIIIISQGKLVASDTPENLERQFAGNEPVEIETRLLPERTEEILSGISGIQKVTYLSGDPGITKAVIETDEDTDIREEVFQSVRARGLFFDFHVQKTTHVGGYLPPADPGRRTSTCWQFINGNSNPIFIP